MLAFYDAQWRILRSGAQGQIFIPPLNEQKKGKRSCYRISKTEIILMRKQAKRSLKL